MKRNFLLLVPRLSQSSHSSWLKASLLTLAALNNRTCVAFVNESRGRKGSPYLDARRFSGFRRASHRLLLVVSPTLRLCKRKSRPPWSERKRKCCWTKNRLFGLNKSAAGSGKILNGGRSFFRQRYGRYGRKGVRKNEGDMGRGKGWERELR